MVEKALLVSGAWLVLCVVAMFEFWIWPRTVVGWALCIAMGPVAYVAGVVAVELTMSLLHRLPWVRRPSEWVERRTAQKHFSWLRVGYALVGPLCLLVVGLILWAYEESRPAHKPGPVQQFIARHYR